VLRRARQPFDGMHAPLSETLNAPRWCWCSPPATLIHGTVGGNGATSRGVQGLAGEARSSAVTEGDEQVGPCGRARAQLPTSSDEESRIHARFGARALRLRGFGVVNHR
jgi:hypothetical protein